MTPFKKKIQQQLKSQSIIKGSLEGAYLKITMDEEPLEIV